MGKKKKHGSGGDGNKQNNLATMEKQSGGDHSSIANVDQRSAASSSKSLLPAANVNVDEQNNEHGTEDNGSPPPHPLSYVSLDEDEEDDVEDEGSPEKRRCARGVKYHVDLDAGNTSRKKKKSNGRVGTSNNLNNSNKWELPSDLFGGYSSMKPEDEEETEEKAEEKSPKKKAEEENEGKMEEKMEEKSGKKKEEKMEKEEEKADEEEDKGRAAAAEENWKDWRQGKLNNSIAEKKPPTPLEPPMPPTSLMPMPVGPPPPPPAEWLLNSRKKQKHQQKPTAVGGAAWCGEEQQEKTTSAQSDPMMNKNNNVNSPSKSGKGRRSRKRGGAIAGGGASGETAVANNVTADKAPIGEGRGDNSSNNNNNNSTGNNGNGNTNNSRPRILWPGAPAGTQQPAQQQRSRHPGPIPDRWLQYPIAIGQKMEGCRFLAFKTPLRPAFFELSEFQRAGSQRFEVETVVQEVAAMNHKLGLVFDLTNTDRYYDAKLWEDHQVKYQKIRCPGHEVDGDERFYATFVRTVDRFMRENAENELLIGVHCTHGLNRTGYLICRYLIEREGWNAKRAIEAFSTARGYPMERDTYIQSLHGVERRMAALNVDTAE